MSRRRFNHKKNPWEKGPNDNTKKKEEDYKNKYIVTDEKILGEVTKIIAWANNKPILVFAGISLEFMTEASRQLSKPEPVLSKKYKNKKKTLSKKDDYRNINKIRLDKLKKTAEMIPLTSISSDPKKQLQLFKVMNHSENKLTMLNEFLHMSYLKLSDKTSVKSKICDEERTLHLIWLHLNEVLVKPNELILKVKDDYIDDDGLWDKHFNGDFTFSHTYEMGGKYNGILSFQKELLKHASKGKNLIVPTKTGTGKTLLTSVIASYYLKMGKTVIFIVPNTMVAFQVLSYILNYADYGFAICTGNNIVTNSKKPHFIIGEARDVYQYISINHTQFDCLYIDEAHEMSMSMKLLLNEADKCQIICLSATIGKESLELLSEYIRSINDRELVVINYDKSFVIHSTHMVVRDEKVSIEEVNPITLIPIDELTDKDIDINMTPEQLYKILKTFYEKDNIPGVLNKLLNKDKDRTPLPYRIMDMDDICKIKKLVEKIVKHEYNEDRENLEDMIAEIGKSEIFRVNFDDEYEFSNTLTDTVLDTLRPALLIEDSPELCYKYLAMVLTTLRERHDLKYPNWLKERETDRKKQKILLERKAKLEEIVNSSKEEISIHMDNSLKLIDFQLSQLNTDIYAPNPEFQLGVPIPEDVRKECRRELKRSVLGGHAKSDIGWDNPMITGLHWGVMAVTEDMPASYQILILKLLSKGYLGLVIGDFKALGQGVNSAVVSVIIPWKDIPGESINKKLQKYTQAKGRAGRKGYENEGHVIYLISDKADEKNIPLIFKNQLPNVSPILDVFPLTDYLKIFSNDTTVKSKKEFSNRKDRMIDKIKNTYKEKSDEFLMKVGEMLELEDIDKNNKWILPIGMSKKYLEIFNDESVVIFYNIIDVVNSDLSCKDISHKEIVYFFKVILWLFDYSGDIEDEDILTLKRQIDLTYVVPMGYNNEMLKIIKENKCPDVYQTRKHLVYLNNEIIKYLLDIEYPNIKAVASIVYQRILNLTSQYYLK